MKQPVKPPYLSANSHACFKANIMQRGSSHKSDDDDTTIALGTHLFHDLENQIEIHKNSIAMPSKGMLDSIMLKHFLEGDVTLTLERTEVASIDIVNTWSERFILKETNQQECSK